MRTNLVGAGAASKRVLAALAAAVVVSAAVVGTATAAGFGGWSPAVNAEAATGSSDLLNTPYLEGCVSQARSGLELYFASNRPGGHGSLDIYRSRRDTIDSPWGPPENLGPVINTAGREFCPTPTRDGHGLFFVSDGHGGCGGSDILYSEKRPDGWMTPVNLGCDVNSAADEAGPFLLQNDHGGETLYFSSARAGGYSASGDGPVSGDSDIYMAPVSGHAVGQPVLVPNVNSAYDDARPNLRRDGLEMFFDSTRPGGCGGSDIWSTTTSASRGTWSAPADLPCTVNSSASEVRASISWDGTTLYFGSTRAGGEGSSDLWFTTRPRTTD